MATVVNDRDVLIMATTPRYTPPTNRGMFLTPSTAVFKLSANGQTASPSSFQFVATLLNMTGTVTWSTTGGISLVTNGNTATLNFASFTGVSGTITATITVDGQQFTQIAAVTKLADGATGPQGSRGNVDISAVTSGSIWSDSEAAAALAAAGYGTPQVRDLVNLYRADRTFSAQRMYNGSAWIAVDYVWNGNMFVKGSILPEAIDTRGLTIRDANGNIILNAGMSLAQQMATNPNLVPRISSWTGYRSNGAWPYVDTTAVVPSNVPGPPNCEFIVLPRYTGTLSEFDAPALPIKPGDWYTVSFYAWNQGNASNIGGSMSSDVYGGNVDSIGANPTLPSGKADFFTYTEQMPANATGTQWLRFFSGDPNNQWLIWNVKVELGKKQTAWCDNVLTKDNMSTYIQAAAIDTAYIADLAVSNAKIANLAVTEGKIENLAVTNAKIANLAVDNGKIANLAVDNAKIADLAVTTLKLAGQAVTIPVSAYTAGSITTPINSSTVIQTAYITSSGAPIIVAFGATVVPAYVNQNYYPSDGSSPTSAAYYVPCSLEVWRNGARLISAPVAPTPTASATPSASMGFLIQDTPGAIGATYQLVLVQGYASGSGGSGNATNRTISLLETKR